MRVITKLLLVLIFGVVGAVAAPARGGVITFTQADGSTFEGLLKGNAAFHWIESNGEIVLYNKEDGNYYKAELLNNKLQMSKERVVTSKEAKYANARMLHVKKTSHRISQTKRELIERLYRDAQRGHRPR